VYPKPALDIINPAVRQTLVQVHSTDPVPPHPGTQSSVTQAARQAAAARVRAATASARQASAAQARARTASALKQRSAP